MANTPIDVKPSVASTAKSVILDLIGGVYWPLYKMAFGDEGSATQVSASDPLPTTDADLLTELKLKADLTETQPVSAASLPLPADAATQTTLAALLTELMLKADLTETQPVDDANSQTILANLLTELMVKADPTELQFVANHVLEVAKGNIPGHTEFFGFGEHSFSGAKTNTDVWGGPTDTQPEPVPAGYALWVESDNDNDGKTGAPSSTGARTVNIHYLDTSGVEQDVDVTLDGTTPVDSGVADCMFVQQHHVVTVGTGLVSAGNIDCTNTSGGTVVSRISTAGNQSMSTMKQVPAGKKLYVMGWHAYGTAATTKIANLRLRSSAHDGVLNAGVYHFHDAARVKDFGSGHIPLAFVCPALATVKVSGWTTGSIDCTARWQGYLVDD